MTKEELANNKNTRNIRNVCVFLNGRLVRIVKTDVSR